MAPRPRKRSKGLPPYLYAERDSRTGRTYYVYHGPDGKRYGLGTDKKDAVRQASDANLRRASTPDELWQRIRRTESPTVADYAQRYQELCNRRGQKASSRKSRQTRLNRIVSNLGAQYVSDLTVRQVADLIEAISAEGKTRLAQTVRNELSLMLDDAMADGLVEQNVARMTRKERHTVQRERLSLDGFWAAYEAAKRRPPWVRRLMELAIVTAQPREVLVAARFSDLDSEWWWVRRGKTGARMKIPLGLRLDAVGWSLRDVVGACRDRVLSPHLLHHTRRTGKSELGDPVAINTASRRFTDCVRDAGVGTEHPPTLHEIRSLSLRLHEGEGRDPQALAGHRSEQTTALYLDSRGSEWVEVRL